MAEADDWLSRRALSDASTIEGARSIAVVDRLARATVWSMTFIDGALPRIADQVLDTVHAVELLFPPLHAAQEWFEVILISEDHYHILRPLGDTDDALVAELVLVARGANLGAARQRFEELLTPYRHRYAPDTLHSGESPLEPASAAGLPRRTSTIPAQRSAPAEPVEERVLHKLVAVLRSLN